MVSIRPKTPSGAAEAIPTPTEMDSRAAEIERRDGGDGGQHDMLFNMGQLLSVPFIIIGIVCMRRALRKARQ